MLLRRQLWLCGRLVAVGAAVAAIGAAHPAWARDADDEDSSKDGKEVRVYRWDSKDDDGGDAQVFEFRDEDGDLQRFKVKKEDGKVRVYSLEGDERDSDGQERVRVERADLKGGFLGVQVQNVTRALMKARNLPSDKGALVNRVEDGSPADEAGIERGDVIVELDRRDIDDATTLTRVVREREPGAKVDVVVVRDGRRKTLRVELGKRSRDVMMLGPGYRWQGEMPDMAELREHLKSLDSDEFRAKMRGMSDGDRAEMKEQMEQLRDELQQLREELRELRNDLRDMNRSRSRSRSGS